MSVTAAPEGAWATLTTRPCQVGTVAADPAQRRPGGRGGSRGGGHTHHHDLGPRAQGHLVRRRARGDPVNEDARVVATDDAHLLQQRVPLEGQHGDLAQDLAGRPPPHRDAAAGQEGTEPTSHQSRRSGQALTPVAPAFWNAHTHTPSHDLVLRLSPPNSDRTQSSLCPATGWPSPSPGSPGRDGEAAGARLQAALTVRQV